MSLLHWLATWWRPAREAPGRPPGYRAYRTTRAYELSTDGRGGFAITCSTCGMTSHNVNDVQSRYCGRCHRFLEV